jgi:hypothetical protein
VARIKSESPFIPLWKGGTEASLLTNKLFHCKVIFVVDVLPPIL